MIKLIDNPDEFDTFNKDDIFFYPHYVLVESIFN